LTTGLGPYKNNKEFFKILH